MHDIEQIKEILEKIINEEIINYIVVESQITDVDLSHGMVQYNNITLNRVNNAHYEVTY